MLKIFNWSCIGIKKKNAIKGQASNSSTSVAVATGNRSELPDFNTTIDVFMNLDDVNNSAASESFCAKVLGEKNMEDAKNDPRVSPIDSAKEVRPDDDEQIARRKSLSGSLTSFNEAAILAKEDQRVLTATTTQTQSFTYTRRKVAQLVLASEASSPSLLTTSDESYREEKRDSVDLNLEGESSFGEFLRRRDRLSLGGSLRKIRERQRRASVCVAAREERSSSLDSSSDTQEVRLRKRVDSSRRDAIEAGFEPRESVPRCHSTQSLKDAAPFSRSEFRPSDLVSSNPGGRGSVVLCDSTTNNGRPNAVVGPRSNAQKPLKPTASRSTYDYNASLSEQYCIDEQQNRRSLQALNASSLYQMTTANRSGQWTPTNEQYINGESGRNLNVQVHCDTSTPNLDQRRSVHNVSRNSFFDGVQMTSTPKSKIAVAPLTKSRHSGGSRDELHLRGYQTGMDRRSSGGALNLPAVQSYMMRHNGEERLVDGPITTSEGARVAYLERKVRELEDLISHQTQPSTSVVQLTPVTQSRHVHSRVAPPTQLIISNNGPSMADQIKMQEMSDHLQNKEKKVAELERKLLKAYSRIERQQEEFDDKVHGVIADSEHARDDLKRMVDKMRQLEDEAEVLRKRVNSGDHTQAHEQAYRELQDKIWKQDREIKDQRGQLGRLREKEAEYEKVRSEMNYLEMRNEELNRTLEAKKNVVEELERSVNTLRLEQTLCQQSCSSGSTPLADDSESMADAIRPSITRPYTKAHSTLGANMSPLPHAKSSGLTKSFSNFAIDASKRDDITPAMSRCIRTQYRHITMSRLMVRCIRDTVEKLARGGNPDVCRLLGIKTDSMSESEFDAEQTAEESKPFSMMAAEKALQKQEKQLKELDSDLEAIRQAVAQWYEASLDARNGEGDNVCRMQ